VVVRGPLSAHAHRQRGHRHDRQRRSPY
jgi:hypothetical protein